MKVSWAKTCAGLILGVGLATTPAWALDQRAEPEPATGLKNSSRLVTAQKFMVAAANPHAVEAGLKMLRRGGSAVDAAIAVQMVLNLVEPQSSGIGGGLFMLHWDQDAGKLASFDGRETAPKAAKPERFLTPDGKPMPFRKAVFGGLSIGVPGALKALALAHAQHGRLPWAELFQPAIQLAQNGFAVSPRLNMLLKRYTARAFGPKARAYFFNSEGVPHLVGYMLKNPDFAESLSRIARKGPDYFYRGVLAQKIIHGVRNAPNHKGDMTLADLAEYKAVERPTICSPYRGFKVCGMGPPSSGALTVNQVLRLLEPYDLGKAPLNASALHLIAEAQKLAYADRKQFMADADFVAVPKGLLDEAYITLRRSLINEKSTMGKARPGRPPMTKGIYGRDATRENSGTSHISIIDAKDNAVSMTSSIEGAFGSRIMVAGFLLNNELTDFSFRPSDKKGRPVANRVESGKRPRSSMAPTVVFGKDGKVKMVVGSPGGSRIILYVLKAIIGYVDWKLDADAITRLPNFGSRNGPFEIEKATVLENSVSTLESFGHKLKTVAMTSGVHVIITSDNGLSGAADPRREGIAAGE